MDLVKGIYYDMCLELDGVGYPLSVGLRSAMKDWYNPVGVSGVKVEEVDGVGLRELSGYRASVIEGVDFRKDGEIRTVEWKIPVTAGFWERYNDEFVRWIDSINTSFLDRGKYSRFELYKRQSEVWMMDGRKFSDCLGEDSQLDYVGREIGRCKDNSLYFLNKYWKYKNPTEASGFSQYESGDAQEIWCFLVDSGYDLLGGKGRQIWFTTTTFGISIKELMYNRSTFIKMITADAGKAVETLESYVRSPMYELDEWMKVGRPSEDAKMYITFHKNKLEEKGGSSMLRIEPPSETAINSGTPYKTFIDEAGLIDIIHPMIENAKATSMQYNSRTGKLEKRGQIIAWGTSDKKNVPQYEFLWRDTLRRWKEKSYAGILVPVFFNAFAKKGMTVELYNQLYEAAYGKDGDEATKKDPHREENIRHFHQANPMSIDDMFLESGDTIIPLVEIKAAIQRCDTAPVEHTCRYGYFTPVYDTGRPLENPFGDMPYKIVGARFEMCDKFSHLVTACIYREPESGWKWRYYKGTDPIMATTGKSEFATVIWDGLYDVPVCCMSMRSDNHREAYLQSYLCHLYYGGVTVKDLVEINIGQPYVDFVKEMGLDRSLVYNIEMPKIYHINSGSLVGINKRGANVPRYTINDLNVLLQLYRGNIWFVKFWEQLKTWVRHTNTNGNDTFKPSDIEFNRDDVIDAMLYAYLCKQCYLHKNPDNGKVEESGKRVKQKLGYDGEWNVVLIPTR